MALDISANDSVKENMKQNYLTKEEIKLKNALIKLIEELKICNTKSDVIKVLEDIQEWKRRLNVI